MATLATLAINIIGNVSGLQSALSSAQKSLDSTGTQIAGLGGKISLATAPLAGIGVMALNSAGDFQQSMSVMQQVSGATADQMQTLQDQALNLGAVTSFSAGEAAQAQLELAKAGLSVNDVMAATPGVLEMAAAGGLGLAESAEIAANAMNAFNLPASEMPRIANMMAATANASSVEVTDLAQGMKMASSVFASSGQSIDDLTIAMGLLGNNALKGSDAGTSLKTMLLSLSAPTDKAAGVLNELGVSVYDAQGKMRELPAILADLNQALTGTHAVTVTSSNMTQEQADRMEYLKGVIQKTQVQLANYQSGIAGVAQSENDKVVAIDRLNRVLGAAQAEYGSLAAIGGTASTVMKTLTEEERNQALATIFGTDAIRAANILLKEGTEGWEEMGTALGNETAAADVANARMSGLNGAMEYLKGSVDSFLIGAALPFLGWIGQLIRNVADAITWLGTLPEPIRNTAIAIGAGAVALGPMLIGLGGFLKLIAFLTPALGVLGTVLGFIVSPIGLVVAALAALVAFDVGGIRTVLGTLANYLSLAATDGDALNDFLVDLPGWMQPAAEAVGKLVAAFGELIRTGDVGAFVDNLRTSFPEAAGAVDQALSTINAAVDATRLAFDQAQSAVSTFLATEAWTTAKDTITASVSEIAGSFGGLFTGDVSLTEFKDKLISELGTIGTAISTLFTSEEFTKLSADLMAAFGLDTLATQIQTQLEPIKTAFQPLLDFLEPALTRLKDTVSALPGQFEALGAKLGPLKDAAMQLGTAIGGIFGGGGEGGGGGGSMALSIGGAILAGSLSLLTNTVNGLVGALAPLAGTFIDQLTTVISGLSEVVTGLGTAFKGVTENNPKLIMEGLQQALQGVQDIVTGTLTANLDGLKIALEAIGTIITTTLSDWGFDAAATAAQTVIDKITLLVDWLKKLVTGDASLNFTAPEWITSLVAWVWPTLSVPDVVKTLVTWVWPPLALPELLSTLLSWAWPGFPTVPNWVSTLLGWDWPDFEMPDWLNRLFTWSWPTLPTLPSWLGGPSEPEKDPNQAVGTSYFGGGFVNASEVGSELAVLPRGRNWLPRGSQIFNTRDSQQLLSGAGGGGTTIVIQNANIRNERDLARLAYQLDDINQRRRR